MRLARSLSVAALVMLAGCMLPRPPDVAQYTKSCLVPGPPPPGSMLFLTTRLPDCRDSSGNKMSWHRGELARYGVWAANGPQFHDKKYWDAELDRQLAAYPETPILYIHGFNNDNGEALARAAAIRLAVGNNRPVIALTWPSYASKRKYFWDEANAEWTAHAARTLLEQFADRGREVVVVAHSMGNRIAIDLLRAWPRHERPVPIKQLIMASPDVDRSWFIQALQKGLPVPITLYGSTKDQPLSASWRSHGYARAGDLSLWVTGNDNGDPYKGAKGVSVVDTSEVASGLLKHADFIESWQGAADLCRLITGEPIERGRLKMTDNMAQLREHPEPGGNCIGFGTEAVSYLAP